MTDSADDDRPDDSSTSPPIVLVTDIELYYWRLEEKQARALEFLRAVDSDAQWTTE